MMWSDIAKKNAAPVVQPDEPVVVIKAPSPRQDFKALKPLGRGRASVRRPLPPHVEEESEFKCVKAREHVEEPDAEGADETGWWFHKRA